MKTIVIVSDVITTQQINGVGTWLIHTKSELEKMGLQVFLLDASLFSYTLPLPSYPEIQLVVSTRSSIEGRLREINPDYIHIATEGTLGLLARSACLKNSWKFTTSYHTRFPEYVFVRTNMQVLKYITYTYMRWFHSRAEKTIVTTVSLQHELEHSHFKNLAVVPLGVDLTLFKKNKEAAPSVSMSTLKKPFFIYMGRLAIEKNINAFLECKLPGSKIVVGDGPERKKLEKKYTQNVLFTGYKQGQELVDILSVCDVFVTPSKTETFGLTIIEALACNLPVAAYDVQGPRDIVHNGIDGYLGNDLEKSALRCLSVTATNCRRTAKQYSWEHATQLFFSNMIPR